MSPPDYRRSFDDWLQTILSGIATTQNPSLLASEGSELKQTSISVEEDIVPVIINSSLKPITVASMKQVASTLTLLGHHDDKGTLPPASTDSLQDSAISKEVAQNQLQVLALNTLMK